MSAYEEIYGNLYAAGRVCRTIKALARTFSSSVIFLFERIQDPKVANSMLLWELWHMPMLQWSASQSASKPAVLSCCCSVQPLSMDANCMPLSFLPKNYIYQKIYFKRRRLTHINFRKRQAAISNSVLDQTSNVQAKYIF